jgi:phytanoyl-CoA hydroxylase
MANLTTEQVEAYGRDGFLVIENFVSPEACRALRDRAVKLVTEWEPTEHRTLFSTNEQTRTSNAEFLDSASTIWCFFEEEAFDDNGRLGQAKELSINKIGHALHDLDPVFEAFSFSPDIADIAERLGLADPVALQSMYIFKQPGIGGEVGCHQDATFLTTDPLTVTGFWFALEDATLNNGCLWAMPGGHRGPLRRTFRRSGPNAATSSAIMTFVDHDPTPLPAPEELTPLPVKAGTMIVLHGLLPHWSDVNRSPLSRHAFSLHCVDATADYPRWNWLQRPDSMPLRRLREVTSCR